MQYLAGFSLYDGGGGGGEDPSEKTSWVQQAFFRSDSILFVIYVKRNHFSGN